MLAVRAFMEMTLIVGKPYIRTWHGTRTVDYPLSISHEKDYVVAVVMNTPISKSPSVS